MMTSNISRFLYARTYKTRPEKTITSEDERWVYGHDEDSRMLQRLKLNHR
jgi:hypothetical protein